MKNLEEIKRIINNRKSFLEERFRVKSVGVFGSCLRGEQHEESDIDILVEFYETVDLFKFIELENFLSELLSGKVDLIMKDALKPRIKDKILQEAINI